MSVDSVTKYCHWILISCKRFCSSAHTFVSLLSIVALDLFRFLVRVWGVPWTTTLLLWQGRELNKIVFIKVVITANDRIRLTFSIQLAANSLSGSRILARSKNTCASRSIPGLKSPWSAAWHAMSKLSNEFGMSKADDLEARHTGGIIFGTKMTLRKVQT